MYERRQISRSLTLDINGIRDKSSGDSGASVKNAEPRSHPTEGRPRPTPPANVSGSTPNLASDYMDYICAFKAHPTKAFEASRTTSCYWPSSDAGGRIASSRTLHQSNSKNLTRNNNKMMVSTYGPHARWQARASPPREVGGKSRGISPDSLNALLGDTSST